jgi:hypothetical protein
MVIGIKLPGDLELLEITQAGGGLSLRPGSTERRQQQACKDGNNRNDHQQLDESETISRWAVVWAQMRWVW